MALDMTVTAPVQFIALLFYSYFSFNAGVDESFSFKTGIPSRDDVLLIAHELGSSWKMVGPLLNVSDAVIDQIEADESKTFDRCYSKCNCVVLVVIVAKHRSFCDVDKQRFSKVIRI